ncbi:hypothetical protein RYX36_018706 [Vicia faba]
MQGENLHKGTWLQEEDEQLISFVTRLGERRWDSLAKVAGLRRSGKSCRLRWLNYLRPNLKHGPFSVEEERLIVQLQLQWGNKWSKIARRLSGRTDNEIKNYWRTHLRKRVQVQQKGEFMYKVENVAHDFNKKSIEVVCSSEGESKENSIDRSPLSDWGMRNSPYHESKILDWIAELQNGFGDKEKELGQDCNSNGSMYEYNPHQEYYDTWDYSGFLWDL